MESRPFFFLVHGFCLRMWYNSSVVDECQRWHCSVLGYMSFMHVDDLNGDPK